MQSKILTNKRSCWDGVNVDSPDHQSHMYDTQLGAFQNGGPCPASHPVRVPQVAYETLWDTSQFNDLWENGENPFFLSYSDHHGYGTHADYVSFIYICHLHFFRFCFDNGVCWGLRR